MDAKNGEKGFASLRNPDSNSQGITNFLSTEHGRAALYFAVLAGVTAAVYKALDNAVMNRYIGTSDEWLAPSTYFIIAAWIGVLLRFVIARRAGHRIDKNFRGLHGGSVRMHRLAKGAGFLSALATLALLRGNQGIDPSLVIILGASQVAFMVIADRIKKQSLGHGFAGVMAITFLGCILASVSGGWESFPWENMAILLFAVGPINGYVFYLGQEGDREADSVIYPFWRFLWLAVTGTIGVIFIALWRGAGLALLESVQHAATSPAMWVIVLLVMLFVSFNDTWETRAKGEAGSSLLYVYMIILVVSIVLGTPITVIGEWLNPGIFGGNVPHDPVVWAIRFVGFALVVYGAYKLRKQLPETAKTEATA